MHQLGFKRVGLVGDISFSLENISSYALNLEHILSIHVNSWH